MRTCSVPSCGSTVGVEFHHLYPKADGCPDELVVPLCHVCHGRTHQFRHRVNIKELARDGAKKRHQRFRGRMKPVVEQMLEEVGSCEELAQKLMATGVKNYDGKELWTVNGVSRLIKALKEGDFVIGDMPTRAPKKRGRKKVADRDQAYAPILREIMASGIVSYNGIADELNRRRIPTVTEQAPWQQQTVKAMLKRLGLDRGAQEYDPRPKDAEIEPLIKDMIANGVVSYKGIAKGLTRLGITTATGSDTWNPISTKAAMVRLGLAHRSGAS